MKTKNNTYPLRLPVSLKAAVEKLSKEDGTSVNQFIVIAVAQKLSSIDTARYFEEKRKNADLEAFRRFLNRGGGEPPRPGDELPQGWPKPRRRKAK